MSIFEENLLLIKSHNQNNDSFKKGVNVHTDMTKDEF